MARRILIVDSDPSQRIAFRAALSAARYNAVTAENGSATLKLLDQGGFDILVVSADLPDLAISGLMDRMGAPKVGDPLCLIVLRQEDSDLRAEWIATGAALTMVQPVSRPWLLSNLRAVLRAHDARQELDRRKQTAARIGLLEPARPTAFTPRIDVVASDRQAAGRLLRGLPDRIGLNAVARTPEECLLAAEQGCPPDLILLAEFPRRVPAASLASVQSVEMIC